MGEVHADHLGDAAADRDDHRQPCRFLPDQHLERPQRHHADARHGLVSLFAENGQEAVDMTIQAFRIAEDPRVLLL